MTTFVGSTRLDLPDTWAYGAGVLHGGWLLEMLAGAALALTEHPHPLAVSAHYAAAPRVGAGDLEVESLREGRSVATLRTRLSQEGRPKVEALVTAGRLPDAGTTPFLADGAPPALPPREDCVRNEIGAGQARNGITEQLDVLLDPATALWASGGSGGGSGGTAGGVADGADEVQAEARAEVRAWVRAVDGREPDPLMLLTVADALPPVTFDLGITGWVPTLELTVLVRAVPVPGWLRVVQRARLIHGGWLDEECEVWDSADQLVAQSRQLAAYREIA